MTSSTIDAARIRQETNIAYLECHPQLASTNDTALERLADAGLPSPALVIADQQTAGRGRGGHQWHSNRGALTFSLIVRRPEALPQDRMALVSLITGLSLREVVSRYVPNTPVQVKWPNDVYVAGKKIAGILLETASTAPSAIVIGIGLNANNDLSSAPSEVQARAVSLINLTRAYVDPTDLIVALLNELEHQYAKLFSNPTLNVALWNEHCLLKGKTLHVRMGTHVVVGKCLGVTATGGIALQPPKGEIVTCYSGEILRFG